jgi:ElaB/YqjD/DUF883 family membrane-anchored ribosome-binding protein
MSTYSNQGNPTDTKTGSHTDRARGAMTEVKRDAADVRESLTRVKDDALKAGSHLAEEAKHYVHAAGDSMHKYQETMNDKIRENPTTSVLVALGVGVVIGRILGGR